MQPFIQETSIPMHFSFQFILSSVLIQLISHLGCNPIVLFIYFCKSFPSFEAIHENANSNLKHFLAANVNVTFDYCDEKFLVFVVKLYWLFGPGC